MVAKVKDRFTQSHIYDSPKGKKSSQQYGHCAETYPLIFLLLVLPLSATFPTIRLRRHHGQSEPQCQGGGAPGASDTQRVPGVPTFLYRPRFDKCDKLTVHVREW